MQATLRLFGVEAESTSAAAAAAAVLSGYRLLLLVSTAGMYGWSGETPEGDSESIPGGFRGALELEAMVRVSCQRVVSGCWYM